MDRVFDQFGKDRSQRDFDDEFEQIMMSNGFKSTRLTDWELANQIAMGEMPAYFLVEKPTQTEIKPSTAKKIGGFVAKFTGWGTRR